MTWIKNYFKNFTVMKAVYLLIAFFLLKKLLPSFLNPFKALFSLLGFAATEGDINTQIGNDNSGGAGGTVNPNNRNQVCLDVANKCQVAIWDYQKNWFGYYTPNSWGEDEDEVILQLNRLNNASEARLASTYYNQVTTLLHHPKSLRTDFIKYLNAADKAKVKAIVKNNLT